jgi:threonine dehydrogenase-like Zn-dependent dehydrogenase
MPKELVAISLRNPVLREYEEPALKAGEVRLRSIFSAPKHGTELRGYRADTKDHLAPFDRERGIHTGESRAPKFPMPLGNTTIGEAIEVGEGVTRFQIGDRVFGHLPIRETHTVHEERLEKVPEGMSAEAIVYVDPASVALKAVREGKICMGDSVAVHGLGAIGQMALQIARLQGARWIVAIDPIPLRRELASRHGADLVLDLVAEDAGLVIKDQTDKIGVDVSLETSGTYAGLNDALRVVGYGGTIVSSAYYTGDSCALSLEGEWHRNRITIVTTKVSDPMRDHPLWDVRRLFEETSALLQEGRLSVAGLVHPIVPFSESDEAYREIDESPAKSIKLGIRHDG